MRVPLSLVAVFCCVACATQPDQSAESSPPDQSQAQNPPEAACRDFAAPVTVGGQPEQASGQACQQPDGSWHITQTIPGLPTLEYALPPIPAYYYPYLYPGYWSDAWDYGAPLYLGSSIVFANGFHHFHHHDGMRHEGFHGGSHHEGGHHDGAHGGFHGGSRGGSPGMHH
jgi:surface antigen